MRPPNKSDTPNAADEQRYSTLADAPVVLVIDEMARIYRMGSSTIRRQLAQGTFRPRPFDVRPYRWLKADVETDLKARAANPARRRRRRRAAAPANGAAAAAEQS